jgi:hypothetical protein
MRNRLKRKIKYRFLGMVGFLLTVPNLLFSQYLNQVNETLFDFETTLNYNFDGEYLTSINALSDSNWVNHGWNVLQFKQYDNNFNVINEKRYQDSINVYQRGGRILFFQNEYYFTGFQKDLYLQGNEVGYIVKFDETGDTIWFKNYFDTVPNARIRYILEKNERLYIGGYFNYSPNPIQHSFVSEIDTDGTILWTKIFNDFNPVTILNFCATTDGLLLSCRYGTGGNNRRVILYKLDDDGNTEWQKTYGSVGSWLINNLAPYELSDGKILLYGFTTDPLNEISANSWILLADEQGNAIKDTVYAFSVFDDHFHYLYSPPILRENDFLILGGEKEEFASPTNAFLACIDYDLNVRWKRTFGQRESNNFLTFIHDLGNDFYLLSGRVDNDANHPTTDEWFVVVDSMGCDVTDCYLGLVEQQNETVMFAVYPNPASDNFTIQLQGNQNVSALHYKLMDMTGKVIQQGDALQTISVSGLRAGVYFVSLEGDGRMLGVRKVVISSE